MRENRQSGSEGGEPQTNAAFLPLWTAGVRKPPDLRNPPNTRKARRATLGGFGNFRG